MLKPIITTLAFSSFIACAAGTAALPPKSAHTVSCLMEAETASSAFPVAIDPKLPSVDRIARLVEADLGAHASAEVELCVSPAGRVVAVSLVRETMSRAFDAAVLHDVAEWQFAPSAASDRRVCKRAAISYVASTWMAAR